MLFPEIDRESVVLGKHTGNGSIISDLFLGARDRMFWDDGIYCCGQNGGKIYVVTDCYSHLNPANIKKFHLIPGGDVAYTGHREGIKPWAVPWYCYHVE